MTVERKSRAESMREAMIERDEDVSTTIILAMSSKTFATKLMKMAILTMREWDPDIVYSGRSGASSSKEGLLDGG